MSDLRQCSREFLTDFIDLYKSFPCLWQIKNKDYSDRNKKQAAYEELVKRYKEIDPQANKETITKKINSLRSVYKKELAKVKKSESSGAGDDDLYKPSLWYFKLLHFLNDQDVPRTPRETLHDDDSDSVVMEHEVNNAEDTSEEAISRSLTPVENTDIANLPSIVSKRLTRKRQAQSTDQQVLDVLSRAEKRLESATSNDSFDRYGSHIADRLRQINPNQVKFVQKIISDLLFEAEFENLNKDWKLVQTQVLQHHVPTYQHTGSGSSHNIVGEVLSIPESSMGEYIVAFNPNDV